eukprot:sb/3472152/
MPWAMHFENRVVSQRAELYDVTYRFSVWRRRSHLRIKWSVAPPYSRFSIPKLQRRLRQEPSHGKTKRGRSNSTFVQDTMIRIWRDHSTPSNSQIYSERATVRSDGVWRRHTGCRRDIIASMMSGRDPRQKPTYSIRRCQANALTTVLARSEREARSGSGQCPDRFGVRNVF